MKGTFIDLTGKRFNRLLVISLAEEKGNQGQLKWKCKCDCGVEKIITGELLRNGHAVSCGCFKRDWVMALTKRDGYDDNTTSTPEYRTWKAMKSRCTNKNGTWFHIYGGKGIDVC